jgi:ATP synthase protein I
MSLINNRPLGVVIRWQFVFAILVAIGCGLWTDDAHGAVSGFLGAAVSALSAMAYAIVVSRHRGYSAGGALRTALRAEAIKIFVIVVALWVVLANYENVRPVIFIGSFIVAVLISSMAIFVPEKSHAQTQK